MPSPMDVGRPRSVTEVDFAGVSSHDVADTATSVTPITIAPLEATTYLTNDGLGQNLKRLSGGITQLYDIATDAIDFSELSLGDLVIVRADVIFTTASANTQITIGVDAGIGGVYPFELPFFVSSFKKAGVNRRIVDSIITMDSLATISNPAKFFIKSDSALGTDTCVVNGFKIIRIPHGIYLG